MNNYYLNFRILFYIYYGKTVDRVAEINFRFRN